MIQRLLFAAGFFLLGWWFHGLMETRSFQREAERTLEERRQALAALETPARNPSTRVSDPRTGEPARSRRALPVRSVIGRIEIPRLGISAAIAEGTEPAVLDRAVGHFVSTALPGEPGNFALAGHRDTFLRGLGRIRPNDVVVISTPASTHRYVVEGSRVVEPERIEVLDPTREPSLTLVTCYPFTFVGPAPKRFIVRAKLSATEAAAVR